MAPQRRNQRLTHNLVKCKVRSLARQVGACALRRPLQRWELAQPH